MATGEGKSTICCILAIVNALRGKNVDVITSSPVLAERDAKEKESLYKMFGLTCAHNGDSKIYLKGPKNCYKQNIVYGEVAQFQFDILRDEYSCLRTMANRQLHVAIVDEVDSMLIDESTRVARLASSVAGMDQFYAFYSFIWIKLLSIRLVALNGKVCH